MTTGRYDQVTPLMSPREKVGFTFFGALGGGLLLWHLAVATTSQVRYLDLNGTVSRLLSALNGGELGWDLPHPLLTLVLFVVLVVGTIVGSRWVYHRVSRWIHAPVPLGTSDRRDIAAMASMEHARDKASHTRPSLNLETAQVHEYGLEIGTWAGERVVLTLEDQVGIVGPTGAGKSRNFMVGAGVDSPGALVWTTTKAKDADVIIAARQKVGTVYVFDPGQIANYDQEMYWDPTEGALDAMLAISRGIAFAGGISNASNDAAKFFQDAAGQVMTRLLMAANLSGGDMRDVLRWAIDMARDGTQARDILKRDPRTLDWGETLDTSISGDTRTVANTKMTLAQKIQPLLAPVVMRQLVPSPGALRFDPTAFVHSRDTLVIISDNNARTGPAIASLATMLLTEVIDVAKWEAATADGDMLDPPLRIVGDEIANVAPLPGLPHMLSDSRGVGVQWVIAFQSLAQLIVRWGQHDAEQILSSLNAILVTGGLMDRDMNKRLSELCGTIDQLLVSSNVDYQNRVTGHQVAVSERPVIRLEEIVHLEDTHALMLLRNGRPMIVTLLPYNHRPDGAQLEAGKRAAAARRRRP